MYVFDEIDASFGQSLFDGKRLVKLSNMERGAVLCDEPCSVGVREWLLLVVSHRTFCVFRVKLELIDGLADGYSHVMLFDHHVGEDLS